MEKFSQIKDKPIISDEELIFSGKQVDIINYKDNEILKINDMVAILPYFSDEATFLMRQEYIPAYQYKNKENIKLRKITNYLSPLTGDIENDESIEQTIRRILFKENGIVLRDIYDFDITGPFFINKYNTSQTYICFLDLPINTYRQTTPNMGKELNDNLSKPIRVSIGDINNIVQNDLLSNILINKLINRIAYNA